MPFYRLSCLENSKLPADHDPHANPRASLTDDLTVPILTNRKILAKYPESIFFKSTPDRLKLNTTHRPKFGDILRKRTLHGPERGKYENLMRNSLYIPG
jgi:hypothetical protein